MSMNESVYERMKKDKELFWLCFGVLYVTEMRKTYGYKTPELKIKSKGLAETWYKLCKKYRILTKHLQLKEKNGVYSFMCTIYSLYDLLRAVKKLPEPKMDRDIRKAIKNFTYSGNVLNKTRIKILKMLNKKDSFTTNKLAKEIGYNSGTVFKKHLDLLHNSGLIKRTKQGKQIVMNTISNAGKEFIEKYEREIEYIPKLSLYQRCFKNRQLAADIMLVTAELEMGGIMQREPYLEMISYDFVEFIRQVCMRWGWTSYSKVTERHLINYPTIYHISLNSKACREIYNLAGPCADSDKDREFKYVKTIRKQGRHENRNQTKNEIINLVNNNINTSREIAFNTQIGIQNIQKHLKELIKEKVLIREKINNKYYYKSA